MKIYLLKDEEKLLQHWEEKPDISSIEEVLSENLSSQEHISILATMCKNDGYVTYETEDNVYKFYLETVECNSYHYFEEIRDFKGNGYSFRKDDIVYALSEVLSEEDAKEFLVESFFYYNEHGTDNFTFLLDWLITNNKMYKVRIEEIEEDVFMYKYLYIK